MRAASFHICNAVILLSVITSAAADGSSQDPRGTRTLTLDAASTALPLVTGGEGYDLLGCFEQPPPNVPGGVLGSDDEYITLMPVPEGTFTIWSCLQGCATSTPKGQSEVHYSFAGIEDGRYDISVWKLDGDRELTFSWTGYASAGMHYQKTPEKLVQANATPRVPVIATSRVEGTDMLLCMLPGQS
jgi:hypothetical protein